MESGNEFGRGKLDSKSRAYSTLSRHVLLADVFNGVCIITLNCPPTQIFTPFDLNSCYTLMIVRK